jgi:plastocyanin
MSELRLLSLLIGALVLAGCGSSSAPTSTPTPTTKATTSTPASPSSAGRTLSLAANPEGQLKYDKTLLTANPGKVTIDFTNMSPLDHNVTLEDSEQHLVPHGYTGTFHGGSKSMTVSLQPGVYKFFCSVPGHRMAGMEGELVVK